MTQPTIQSLYEESQYQAELGTEISLLALRANIEVAEELFSCVSDNDLRLLRAICSMEEQWSLAAPRPDNEDFAVEPIERTLLDLINVTYTDELESIESYQLDEDGTIKGVGIDIIGVNAKKRISFEIDDDNIKLKVLNPDDVERFAIEVFAVKKGKSLRPKNCTKGLPCGGSCQSVKNVCTKGLSPEQKKLAEQARRLMKKGQVGPAVDIKQNRQPSNDVQPNAAGIVIPPSARKSADQLEEQLSTSQGRSDFIKNNGKPSPEPSDSKGYAGLNLAREIRGEDSPFITVEQSRGVNGWVSGVRVDGTWDNPRLLSNGNFVDSTPESRRNLSKAGNGTLKYKTEDLNDGIYVANSAWRSKQGQRVYFNIEDHRIIDFTEDANLAKEWLSVEQKKILKDASDVILSRPKLSGSDKQVQWANSIREKAIKAAKTDEERQKLLEETTARFWIDNRYKYS